VKVIYGIDNYKPLKSCALTIGTFDGVHVGHQKIIRRLVSVSKNKNINPVVLTFFPHPRMILQNETSIKLIDTLEEKIHLLKKLNIGTLIIHPFSKSFSRMTANEFIRDIIVKSLSVKYLIIGYDHRFGRNREATVDNLITCGFTFGFEVEKIEAKEIKSVNVSSTKIRNAISTGDIHKANQYLNRPFRITGKVVTGNRIGRKIDFPTANISITEDFKLLPKDGVYFVKSLIKSRYFFGMMNIGFRPTVNGKARTTEVHYFNFNENLYDKKVKIEVLDLIRNEKKFNSLEDLEKQLVIDKKLCEDLIQKL
jgi:riboflavin kinase/FMN adenylyltransferase